MKTLELAYPNIVIADMGYEEYYRRLSVFQKISSPAQSEHKTVVGQETLIEFSKNEKTIFISNKDIHINTFGVKPGLFYILLQYLPKHLLLV